MRAVDIYRALLWCYPAQFRHEYGREMVGAFSADLVQARHEAGRRASAAVWIRTLVDLLPTAFREHRHVIQQDLRHALRVLAASRGFTAVAVLSLALGIGANTAIFSLLNSVLLQTLPVPHPETLVMLTDPDSSGVSVGQQGGERSLMTYTEFRQLQAQATTVTPLLASQSSLARTPARIGGGEPEDIGIRLVSASYFQTLGVSAVLGRTFDAAREPDPGAAPYAVLSFEYWQRRFGGKPDVLGRPIAFRNGVVTVIGVMPSRFFGETVGDRPDVWIPLAMQAAVIPGRDWLRDQPGSVEKVMWLHVFGRLKPGASPDQAQADVNLIFQHGLSAYYGSLADPAQRKQFLDQRLRVRGAANGASSLRGDFTEPLYVLLGAAGLVLLIACSNLGNLLLARTTARNREMAVRLALGASRARVVRQLLTESLCLACLGGLIGVALAIVLRQGLLRLVSDDVALTGAIDIRVLAFAFALTLVAGVIMGLLPALRITKINANAGLREQGRGIAGSAAWLRVGKAVVIGQLALSLPLLIGCGLLVRTLGNLQNVDLGYPKDHLLTVRVDAEPAGYDGARQSLAFESLLAGIRALPGVSAATYSSNGLLGGSDNGDQVVVEGYTTKGDGDRGSRYDAVGPDYFSTLGIPVMLGREITAADRPGGRTVCVINQTFARDYFQGRNPLGMHVTQQYASDRHTYEIVGVVRDARQDRLRRPIEHRFYTPVTQPAASIGEVSFLVRWRGDNAGVLTGIRRLLQRTEPNMAIVDTHTVQEGIDRRTVQDRMLARLSVGFGVVALLLAAIGLYGVLSYGVARRTNEIGVRKALGARETTLIVMILRESSWLLVIGLIAGGALSAAAMQLIASRLYGLSPGDPVTISGAVLVLAAVAIVATWLPAYRASRVDPLVALRYE